MDTEVRSSADRDRPPALDGRAGRSLSAVRHWWRGLGFWQELALLAVICCTVIALVSAFVAQPFLIPSGSMENTVRIGDRVLVDKLAYRFGGAPRRGDVVVFDGTGSFDFRTPPRQNPAAHLAREAFSLVGLANPDGTDYIKRVVGIGGDHVACCDRQGRITVNGHAVTEPYLYPGDTPSQVPFSILVPPGQLWVMGDHRSASSDSRAHLGDPGGGTVPVGKVIGRADWIVWPFDRAGSLRRPPAFDGVPAAPTASTTPAGGAHG
ncbi:signal peptidase I [Streptantibioticus silvisoli]|uniref:Signal peptidase I n=1 Tax=Streptantibioticus silvisoli TaxID=2705255 RepID=A0ABT6WAN9_9ACTN|nr:signal peptidase I [Streptantibioticus silvisoli]MDI5967543.1 signal peptidase I [Streptantibioticus silvisoli]